LTDLRHASNVLDNAHNQTVAFSCCMRHSLA
jgi:hypothetical protein